MPHIYRKDLFDEYFVRRFRNAENDLTPRERKLVERYGTRLEALQKGTLTARTDEEKHFMLVCEGSATPTKAYERAWLKYQSLLRSEGELEAAFQKELRQSPAYIERLKSRLSAAPKTKNKGNQPSLQSNRNLKKCSICGGTNYECWKCNGRGLI